MSGEQNGANETGVIFDRGRPDLVFETTATIVNAFSD